MDTYSLGGGDVIVTVHHVFKVEVEIKITFWQPIDCNKLECLVSVIVKCCFCAVSLVMSGQLRLVMFCVWISSLKH